MIPEDYFLDSSFLFVRFTGADNFSAWLWRDSKMNSDVCSFPQILGIWLLEEPFIPHPHSFIWELDR